MEAVLSASYAFTVDDCLKAAAKSGHEAFSALGQDGAQVERFLRQVQEDAVAEDLDGLSLEAILALAADFWVYSRVRKADETLMRVRPGEGADGRDIGRDILEIVSVDRPFLVDSVMGCIAAEGHDVLAMFHPIIPAKRDKSGKRETTGEGDPESMIQVHLETMGEAERQALLGNLKDTLEDVRLAVVDWPQMVSLMDNAIQELETSAKNTSEDELAECVAFLRWLRDDHFAFLGSRQVEFLTNPDGTLQAEQPDTVEGTEFGILRDEDRFVLRRESEPTVLSAEAKAFLEEPNPLIVAKSNLRSTVHRRVYMDYIGVKRFGENGEVVGETRFVGLFTAEAYNRMARDVPLLRRKVRRVLERADKLPGSHNAKKLQNIVENYPRDELFQTDEDDLLSISLGVLHLEDRPRPRLFLRRDRFNRFISALVFVPRERYNTRLREQIGAMLKDEYGGRLSAFYPQFGDGALARVHFIIGLNPYEHADPDPRLLERKIVELARTWLDDFEAVAREAADQAVTEAAERFGACFNAGYRERFTPEEALDDVRKMAALDGEGGIQVRAWRRAGDEASVLRFKLYHGADPLALSKVMPILEHLGLNVIWEAGYKVDVGETDADSVWIHDFEMRAPAGADPEDRETLALFEEAFVAAWRGWTESDGFNALILKLGIGWRDAAFLRACARFRRQTGADVSQVVQEETLVQNPDIARLLLALRDARFDPDFDGDIDARKARADEIDAELEQALNAVHSLDHDRVSRRLRDLVKATLRTNYYQRDAEGHPLARIALKIDSKAAGDLPNPKPYREIFVWAPEVEGVHLRFGPVARGGLRWSDRRDDFRTEVLGLVKAQQVKNAVIVPVGSKGGFYPKRLPVEDGREAVFEEGKRAYKTFIRGLLDLTDNIADDGVRHPRDMVIWDDEDPYLVVAADKGTATFSDIANSISAEYEFWLGDAFASGGSVGYDHKAMGITARGGWEAVKRHFRELGKDIQSEPFTVIGVGDMSGDVFGNGMLLSQQIRLLAAFDHRDIFIDPDPDPAKSFAERKRLFETPGVTWQDYDKSLISKGGGVFPRTAKSVTLTDEIKALAGVSEDEMTPNALIHALLKAEAELLWFGGIGTYVKSSEQQHWQAGDKANDGLRVDASEMRVKVIGEGANLGVTQRGRIEFARHGGKINTDAVDNSAGVDCSDHEVNIKILLNGAVRAGKLDQEARNALLADMTSDVSSHVLKHNYHQTLALSIAEVTAAEDLDSHERTLVRMESRGAIDREVETLPPTEAIAALREEGKGLTRPEISVLLAYAKLTLFDDLVASSVPEDPHFETLLKGYFPDGVQRFDAEMDEHRLKREIIATVLANQMCDLGGPTFMTRAHEMTGSSAGDIARAFESARRIFRFNELTDAINALDNKVPASVQIELHRESMHLLRRQTYWLARRVRTVGGGDPRPVAEIIGAYRPGVDALKEATGDMLSPFQRRRIRDREEAWVKQGAPEDLAHLVAQLGPLTSASDIIDLSEKTGWPLESVAWLYHRVAARFDLDRLRIAALSYSSDRHWDRLAARRLVEELYSAQHQLTSSVLRFCGSEKSETPGTDWAKRLVERWVEENSHEAGRVDEAFAELRAGSQWTLSKLAIVQTYLREFGELAQPR